MLNNEFPIKTIIPAKTIFHWPTLHINFMEMHNLYHGLLTLALLVTVNISPFKLLAKSINLIVYQLKRISDSHDCHLNNTYFIVLILNQHDCYFSWPRMFMCYGRLFCF